VAVHMSTAPSRLGRVQDSIASAWRVVVVGMGGRLVVGLFFLWGLALMGVDERGMVVLM
jgi:hypothetical protein